MLKRNDGFTLLEIAIMLVIGGTMLQLLLKGQDLIQNARVRDIMSQQSGVESAVLAFQDRFRGLPGDYSKASADLNCGVLACFDGNGDGRVEAGGSAAIHEEILAWHHLHATGFIEGDYSMNDPTVTQADILNTPRNPFGGYLEIAYDNRWSYSGNTVLRHNIKTGNLIFATVLSELDRKIDDGLPGSGHFQFSSYAGAGKAPPAGAPTGSTCTDADAPSASWREIGGGENCGATTLMH